MGAGHVDALRLLPSGNGYKVRLTLRELARPFACREVDILRGETRESWFLAKNPVGEISVLELDDGICLSESTAILFHVAQGVISRAVFRRRYPDAVPTRPEEFDAWWAQGARALGVLDAHLTSRDDLVADRFSIADIALYAYIHRAAEGGFDLGDCSAPARGFAQIERRPAYLPFDQVPLAAASARWF